MGHFRWVPVSHSAGEDAAQPVPWPRGFGHVFVTRYQLRTRHFLPADVGDGEWGDWEVYPDCALPPEQPGGNNTHTKGYKSPMPLPESRDLVAGTAQSSEIVQVCIRVGDGLKWSPWKAAKELPVVVEKPMASEEEAFGLWRGSVCRVAWPPVVVHAGIQEVEYQLMVIPDSAYLLPFVGAVIIAPGQQEGRAGRPRSRKGVSISKSSQTKETRGRDTHQGSRCGALFRSFHQDLPKVFPLKSVPKLVAGQARLKSASAAHLEGLGRDDYVVIEFTELCPDLRYAFQVLARYPTVGPRSFHKIYEVEKISKSAAEDEQVDTQVTAACTAPVPTPVQVPLLEESQEKMQRWLQDGDGRLVLLTWLGLQPEAENPRQASIQKLSGNSSSNKQYEVQAAQWEDDGPEGREWVPCPVVSAPFLFEGSTCIAVRSLPFAIGKFRLFDPQMMRTGTATPPIVTVFERIVEPGPVEMIAKGQPPRRDSLTNVFRTLAVLLTLPLDMPLGTGGRATCCQIRFRPMGRDGDPSKWEELDVQSLPTEVRGVGKGTGKRREAAVVVREEDGLELGHVYEFQVRLGDRCRMGNWSKPFRPLRFALSPPTPSEGSGLKVCEKGDRAEISWAPFKPDEVLAAPQQRAQLPGFAQLPIEYTLSILAGAHQEPLSSLVTCETSAQVYGLHPLSSYSAMLVARWSRFGKLTAEGRDKGHVLMAAFVTSGLGGSKLTAELSVRVPTEQLDGYGPAEETVLGPDTLAGMLEADKRIRNRLRANEQGKLMRWAKDSKTGTDVEEESREQAKKKPENGAKAEEEEQRVESDVEKRQQSEGQGIQETAEEKKPERATEHRVEEKAEEEPEDKTEKNAEHKTEEKAEEQAEEKAEEKAEEQAEDKTEEKAEEQAKDKTEEKAEEKTECKTEEKAEEKTECKTEEKAEHKTAEPAEPKPEEKGEESEEKREAEERPPKRLKCKEEAPQGAVDAFVKTCRKKAQLISEDDLFVDGQFMSEQDMIDEGFKEYPVCIM
eukprot:g22074.t1